MTLKFDPKTHTYTVDGETLPSVTQILRDMGFVDTTWFTDYSRERGSLVHKIIKWHCQGVLDETTIDPVLRPYFDAWLKFVDDTGFISKEVEIPAYSSTFRFAGTPDHVGILNVQPAILDCKTGIITPVVGLQLAGYEQLTGVGIKRFGLQLTDQGKYKLTEFKDRNDRQVFLAAVACWHWIRNH